jgi:hypothetical protein
MLGMLLKIAGAVLVGASAAAVGYAVYERVVEGALNRQRVHDELQNMQDIFKAEIKNKDHKHISLSAITDSGETKEVTIYADDVEDDICVGDLIYV